MNIGIFKKDYRIDSCMLGVKQYSKKRIAIYCNMADPYCNKYCSMLYMLTFRISDQLVLTFMIAYAQELIEKTCTCISAWNSSILERQFFSKLSKILVTWTHAIHNIGLI